MKPIHFLGVLFLIVTYFVLKVFYPFLNTMIIAILLALASYKMHSYFMKKLPGQVLPATASTAVLAFIFFLPIIYIITNAATFVANIDFDLLKQTIAQTKNWIVQTLQHNSWIKSDSLQKYFEQFDIQNIINWVIQTATFLGKKSANFFKDIFLILIFYFFANLYGKDLLLYFQNIIPFRKEDSKLLFENLAGVMGVVFNSIIATAVLEGILFGIIVQIYGYNGIMLGILYGFASLIPVIGGIIMWLPITLHQYFLDNTTGAIVIALYSIIVISGIADTIIKPIIIKYIDQVMIEDEHVRINELLIFFSIVAGLTSYGFWGMIIGPAVITLFISILKIYPKITKLERE
ncbi:AI-2E family transporter [Nitratiruptor sp. SB155-2]|uniref:AI-2E family transporter n=1 Tax=Nitratiruptor sp. (strain SB155-2) TaxID=387092 RepID=UPI0001586E75|nr:AI-2E family transporter [Nitratiruptor sp. SB155-2]BAF69485.1 conserved hypothetical protein [Nitratiruptor sp. SB155-2]